MDVDDDLGLAVIAVAIEEVVDPPVSVLAVMAGVPAGGAVDVDDDLGLAIAAVASGLDDESADLAPVAFVTMVAAVLMNVNVLGRIADVTIRGMLFASPLVLPTGPTEVTTADLVDVKDGRALRTAYRMRVMPPFAVPEEVAAPVAVLVNRAGTVGGVRHVMPLAVPEVVPATGVMAVAMPILVVTVSRMHVQAPRAMPEEVTSAIPVDVEGSVPSRIAASREVGRIVPFAVPVEMAAAAVMNATGETSGQMGRVVPRAVPVIVPASPPVMMSPVKLGIVAIVGVRDVGPVTVPVEVSAAVRVDVDMPLRIDTVRRMRSAVPRAVPVEMAASLVMGMAVVGMDGGYAPDAGTQRRHEKDDKMFHGHKYSTPHLTHKGKTTRRRVPFALL